MLNHILEYQLSTSENVDVVQVTNFKEKKKSRFSKTCLFYLACFSCRRQSRLDNFTNPDLAPCLVMINCRPAQCEDGASRKVGEKTSIQEIAGGTSVPDEDNTDPVRLDL